jgi:hypothetical protein
MLRKKRVWVVLGAGFLTLCCLAVVQRPLRQWVSVKVTLANPSPRADQVEAVIKNSTDCEGTIIAVWNTGKIIQREVAAKEIADPNVIKGKLPDDLEAIALRGCLDVDLDVREACLAALDTRKDSAFAALASAQLNDCDPQIRLLGLQHLRHIDAELGIPAIIPILDDDDPEVAATGLKLLEHWTSQNFGVRVREIFPGSVIVGWKYELEGTRIDAMIKASRQLADNGTDICVLNGRAYGAGFGICRNTGLILECRDKQNLVKHLSNQLEAGHKENFGNLKQPVLC